MSLKISFLSDNGTFLRDAYLSSSPLNYESLSEFGLRARNVDNGFEILYSITDPGPERPIGEIVFIDHGELVAKIEADPSLPFDMVMRSIHDYLDGDPTGLQALLSDGSVVDMASATGGIQMDYPLWSGVDAGSDVRGSAFDDMLVGTRGDDTIHTGGGVDVVFATAGDDTIDFGRNASLGVKRSDGAILLYEDPFSPASFANFRLDLFENTGTVATAKGTDTLFDPAAAAAADGLGLILVGTSGDDTYVIDGVEGGNVGIGEFGGDDTIVLRLAPGEQIVRLVYGFENQTTGLVANFRTGVVAQDGTGGRDQIEYAGNSSGLELIVETTTRDDRLIGRAGPDTFILIGGNDTIDGGDGHDGVLYASDTAQTGVSVDLAEGTATGMAAKSTFLDSLSNIESAAGTHFADTLVGSDAANQLFGNGGRDVLRGGAGNDTLSGGGGADFLDGGLGADIMNGGSGDDTFVLDHVGDRFDAGPGADRLITSVDVELGDNASVAEILLRGDADLRVDGDRFGSTRIVGNGGDNILVESGGADTLEGGGGRDVFAFRDMEASQARILDFEAGDRIALDDGFFGLGDRGVDPRAATADQIAAALNLGVAVYDRGTGTLSYDRDGRAGPGEAAPIVTLDGAPALGAGDILLF